MLPDRVSNPGPLTYESGALPMALRGPARSECNGVEQRKGEHHLLHQPCCLNLMYFAIKFHKKLLTIMRLNIGTPKNNKFSICSKWKIYYFLVSQNLGK